MMAYARRNSQRTMKDIKHRYTRKDNRVDMNTNQGIAVPITDQVY